MKGNAPQNRKLSLIIRGFSRFIISLWIIVTATFFLMHALPGDPFSQEQALPQEILEAMQRHYHLDQPLSIQYLYYVKGILSFDLGPSLRCQGRHVTDILYQGFPISFCLGMEALCIALSLGVFLGSLGALYQGKCVDRLALFFSIFALSIPSFLLATCLQYLFAMKIPLFPVARFNSFAHTILPALSLAALPAGFIAKLLRASILDVIKQDYMQMAFAKGLSPARIFFHYILRNALLPVLAYLGPLTTSILTGGFAVERVFGIPGLGKWFVLSIKDRDYPVIMGTAIFYSIVLMCMLFIFECLSILCNPKAFAKEVAYDLSK